MSARWESLRVWARHAFPVRSRLSTAEERQELAAFAAQRRSANLVACQCNCDNAGHVATCTGRATILARTGNTGREIPMCAPCASAITAQWADPADTGRSPWITRE